jgi:hypothetical protein
MVRLEVFFPQILTRVRKDSAGVTADSPNHTRLPNASCIGVSQVRKWRLSPGCSTFFPPPPVMNTETTQIYFDAASTRIPGELRLSVLRFVVFHFAAASCFLNLIFLSNIDSRSAFIYSQLGI